MFVNKYYIYSQHYPTTLQPNHHSPNPRINCMAVAIPKVCLNTLWFTFLSECITCYNVEILSAIPKEIQSYLGDIESTYRVPHCKKSTQPSTKVTRDTCPGSELQQVSRCGSVTGSLDIKLSLMQKNFGKRFILR